MTALHEVVSDNDAGVVVPPGDPAALAAAITALLDNREERDRLGRNGRNAFAHRYTAARMTDDVVALYREIGERERVR